MSRNTETAAAHTTGRVVVIPVSVFAVGIGVAKTILSLATAILETVEQIVFLKECQSAEDRATVYRREIIIKFFERKGCTIRLYPLENEQPYCCCSNAVLLQNLFKIHIKTLYITCKNIFFCVISVEKFDKNATGLLFLVLLLP